MIGELARLDDYGDGDWADLLARREADAAQPVGGPPRIGPPARMPGIYGDNVPRMSSAPATDLYSPSSVAGSYLSKHGGDAEAAVAQMEKVLRLSDPHPQTDALRQAIDLLRPRGRPGGQDLAVAGLAGAGGAAALAPDQAEAAQDNGAMPGWAPGALMAQDAYRGDYAGGWPSPQAPRVGITGGLPGGFADAMRGIPSGGDATGRPGRMGSLAEMTPTPAEHVRDVARYVGESLVHPFEMTNAAMQGVTPEVPGMWSEADDYRRDVLNRDLNTFTNKTAAGMVFDPMMALGTKVGVPGYSLGSGAGSKIIQPQPKMGDLAEPPSIGPALEAIQRQPVVRGRSGRPIETAPLPIGTEDAILAKGYERATGPRQIESFDDIRSLLDKQDPVYVRWSASPQHDMTPGAVSRDYQSGQMHEGLSALGIKPAFSDNDIFKFLRDYGYLRAGNNPAVPRLYSGKAVGKDTDFAESIVPTASHGRLSDNFIRFLDDEKNLQRMNLTEDLAQGRKALAYYAANPPPAGDILIWTPEKVAGIEARLAELGGPVKMPGPPPMIQAMARTGEPQPAMEAPGMAGAAEAPFSPADVSKLTPRNINKFTSGEAQRVAFPGVYKDPRLLAQEAALKVAPEHPALKQLFGVTRDDLYGISQQGTRQGNVEPRIWYPDTPRGSYAAERIMNPKNAQRMVDALGEAEKYPHLTRGMDAWYVMDPAFQRMVQLVGREQAIKDYQRFNMTVPPFSAGSNVLTEINRGTAANMMAKRGDYPTFEKYAGVAEDKRGADFPAELRDVMGHAYHGIQADPVTRYLATGEHGYHRDTVKIPLYTQASGVPETGFQTRLPVPDAHFARASGMADVRENKSFADYMSGSEYRPFGPWYRENVAKPLGIEAVPAQGRMWGLYAPQTGVDTAVGAPKLELLAQSIWERANRLGVDPAVLRDQVLRGDNHALWLMGIPTGVAAGVAARGRMGDLAAQDTYQ